jgi:hypothetical protein
MENPCKIGVPEGKLWQKSLTNIGKRYIYRIECFEIEALRKREDLEEELP